MSSAHNRDNREKELLAVFEAAKKCSARVVQFLKDPDQKQVLAELYGIVEGCCVLDNTAKINDQSLREAAETELAAEQEDFKALVLARIEVNLPDLEDPKTHDKYISFDRTVKAMLEEAEMDESGSDVNGDDSDTDDDDVRMTEAEVNDIDPISQQVMVSPVRNKLCGHTYEKKTIMELLKQRSTQRCPYVGCPQHPNGFTANDLEDDVKLKQILRRRQRSQQ